MLQVRLLGEQSITDDVTGAVRLRSSRAVALIAYLVVHAGYAQPRTRLAGLFWPDSTDAQALTNLRRELHHMRHVLAEDESLAVTSTDLCWRDTATSRVDVRTFDVERRAAQAAAAAGDVEGILAHAAVALAQYGGELLPGGYDEWLLEPRSELEDQCVELCDLVSAARVRVGDLRGAVEAVRRRIALRPLEEIGYRTLMDVQAGLGDRAAAVSSYHRCASVLERELGVAPDPATREALQRVLAQAPPPDVPRRTAEPVGTRSGQAGTGLVGRDRELGRLEEVWRSAAQGRAALALVRGGAGVGKSRLVAELADLARVEGAVVAASRCFGGSVRPTLAPVADWLRHSAVRSATASLDPSWRAEVDRLMPSRAARPEHATGARALADAWQRSRFFEGLARALLGVRRPTLLVVDNLQWCDQETLAFLAFLLGLAPDAPVLVAGTLRDDNLEVDREVADWTGRMRATGCVTDLVMSPLDLTGTAQLAEAITARSLSAEEVDLVAATTGGFPLYVIEAARTMVDRGAASLPRGDLSAVLRDRLGQASEAAREVAGLAAAVGRNFSLDLLTEASDLGPDTVVRAVDELWRRRIMREFRDGYDFSHDLLRETAYSQVSPPKRWLLHRRIAQGLELVYGGNADPVCAQLADQYARGGRPERAVACYRRAAEIAAGTFSHAEAIRLHQKALLVIRSLPEGTERDRQELATLEAMAAPLNARYGYSSLDLQHALERSTALAEGLGRRDSVLTSLVGLWASRFVQGRTTEGHRAAIRALSMVDATSDRSASAHFAVGGSAVSLGSAEEGVRHLELAATLASGAVSLTIGTRPDVHGTAWAAHAHWLLGQDEQARESCRQAIELARAVDHPYSLAVALAYGCITDQIRGDADELRTCIDELCELCDRYDFAYYREWGLILRGWSSADPAGIELVRRGIDTLKSAGSFARMPYWLALLADLMARNGRSAAARATLDAALVTGQAHDDLWWLPEVMRMRAAYDTEHAAVARLRRAAAMARAHGSVALLRRCERDLDALS